MIINNLHPNLLMFLLLLIGITYWYAKLLAKNG